MRALLLIALACSALLYDVPAVGSAGPSVISRDAVDSVSIGDSPEKIFSVFGSRFKVSDVKGSSSPRTVTLMRGSKRVITFSVGPDNRIFLIEIFSDYTTAEGIGPGTRVAEALGVYGHGTLAPTDQGYVLTFDKLSGLAFLLNTHDIPKKLRNIPDDVFTQDDEKRILAVPNLRVSSIQIFPRE